MTLIEYLGWKRSWKLNLMWCLWVCILSTLEFNFHIRIMVCCFIKQIMHLTSYMSLKWQIATLLRHLYLKISSCARIYMDSLLVDPKIYKCLVGKLVFMTNTKWDIAIAMNLLSWFVINPQIVHFQVVKFIICYIKGTLNFGIL